MFHGCEAKRNAARVDQDDREYKREVCLNSTHTLIKCLFVGKELASKTAPSGRTEMSHVLSTALSKKLPGLQEHKHFSWSSLEIAEQLRILKASLQFS